MEEEQKDQSMDDWKWRKPVAEDPEALSRNRRWARDFAMQEYGFTEEQVKRLFPLPDEGET